MLTRREALQRAAVLLGYAVSGSTVAAVMSGCQADPRPDWTPRFFTPMQLRQVSAMLDHLLPKTATPGALDVQVDRFLDMFLADFASPEDRQTFLAGLTETDERSRELSGRTFVDLPADGRDAVFRGFEAQAPPVPPTIWGGQISATVAPLAFYRQFKQLALVGYYTSAEVGLHILTYDPVPGRFDGCLPLSDVGNQWSL
jgi:glucoside 3-dehydrogenase (cytochrome c) hitch-hiker subunit